MERNRRRYCRRSTPRSVSKLCTSAFSSSAAISASLARHDHRQVISAATDDCLQVRRPGHVVDGVDPGLSRGRGRGGGGRWESCDEGRTMAGGVAMPAADGCGAGMRHVTLHCRCGWQCSAAVDVDGARCPACGRRGAVGVSDTRAVSPRVAGSRRSPNRLQKLGGEVPGGPSPDRACTGR